MAETAAPSAKKKGERFYWFLMTGICRLTIGIILGFITLFLFPSIYGLQYSGTLTVAMMAESHPYWLITLLLFGGLLLFSFGISSLTLLKVGADDLRSFFKLTEVEPKPADSEPPPTP